MNRRRTTSPSTRWSKSRGGYWIGGAGFSATGGSSDGGVSLAAPSGGGPAFPHAQTVAATSSPTAPCLTAAPRGASSRRRDGSALRAATARLRPADRKCTRLNSSHTVISPLSLHDALPIWFSATGGSSDGGVSLAAPSGGGPAFPHAQTVAATSSPTAPCLTAAPRGASSRRRDGSALRAATARLRP